LKDTGKIRQIVSGLLSSITYNSVSVPVYEDDPILTVPDNWIQILQVDESTIERNNNRFISSVSVQVDVITRQYKTSSTTACDAISESILEALITSVDTQIDSTYFHVANVYRESGTYLHEVDGEYHINRKILVISFNLIQK
jgi:hypothetical protein